MATLKGCDLSHTNFQGADLTLADLTGSDMTGCLLLGAKTSWADFTETCFDTT